MQTPPSVTPMNTKHERMVEVGKKMRFSSSFVWNWNEGPPSLRVRRPHERLSLPAAGGSDFHRNGVNARNRGLNNPWIRTAWPRSMGWRPVRDSRYFRDPRGKCKRDASLTHFRGAGTEAGGGGGASGRWWWPGPGGLGPRSKPRWLKTPSRR